MAEEIEPTEAHLYLTDRPLGRYVGDLDVTVGRDHGGPQYKFEISLRELYTLRQHLDNTIHAIEDRQLTDAVAGDCEKCHNTRMVDKPGHGGRMIPQGDHCPVCNPKIEHVRKALREGHPPAKHRVAKKKSR